MGAAAQLNRGKLATHGLGDFLYSGPIAGPTSPTAPALPPLPSVSLLQEALRMNPPLLLVMRYAKEAFKVTTSQGKTYTVPKVRSVLGWGAGARTTGGCS